MSQAAPPSFTCRLSNHGEGTAYLRPVGEVDLATAPQLDEALVSALRDARLVVLDLAELSFLDSSGVHVITAATATARARGGRVVTVRGLDRAHDIFALTGTEDDVELSLVRAC